MIRFGLIFHQTRREVRRNHICVREKIKIFLAFSGVFNTFRFEIVVFFFVFLLMENS